MEDRDAKWLIEKEFIPCSTINIDDDGARVRRFEIEWPQQQGNGVLKMDLT